MSRTVMCKKFGKELPGLSVAPFPGEAGKEIFNNYSQQAWSEWLSHQTMLINEKQLSMANGDHRSYLKLQMEKFLNNEEVDRAEGYVPEAGN